MDVIYGLPYFKRKAIVFWSADQLFTKRYVIFGGHEYSKVMNSTLGVSPTQVVCVVCVLFAIFSFDMQQVQHSPT